MTTLTTSTLSTEVLEDALLTLDQAPSDVETELDSLWPLMRFLSLRLKPKAAARPRIGSVPGTFAGLPLELALTWTEMVSKYVDFSPGLNTVHVPRIPELGIPKDASVMPLKVDLLEMGEPETYVESR